MRTLKTFVIINFEPYVIDIGSEQGWNVCLEREVHLDFRIRSRILCPALPKVSRTFFLLKYQVVQPNASNVLILICVRKSTVLYVYFGNARRQ